uniref:Uncharacterized protein n=1 Tax=Rhizophora mucronata TaxID=61149 RepID=A0A2P2PNA6_RHIMU
MLPHNYLYYWALKRQQFLQDADLHALMDEIEDSKSLMGLLTWL